MAAGLVVIVIVAGIAGAYYVSSSMGAPGPVTLTVNIPNGIGSNQALNYSPAAITLVIGVNNTVNFVNQDSAAHTVTASDMGFNSGNMAAGGSWKHTFFTAGTFSFHCLYHGWMTGTITVKS